MTNPGLGEDHYRKTLHGSAVAVKYKNTSREFFIYLFEVALFLHSIMQSIKIMQVVHCKAKFVANEKNCALVDIQLLYCMPLIDAYFPLLRKLYSEKYLCNKVGVICGDFSVVINNFLDCFPRIH